MHDDILRNKLVGFVNSKDAKLNTLPVSIKADTSKKEKNKPEDKPEKPSKAQSEYEQFIMDWEPGDPLPLFPPGKILKLCHLSNNPMVTGSDAYIDNPATTKRPYKNGRKSADDEFIELKNLGPKIKEGLTSLLGMVARSRGLWVDDKNKLRCPPGTPAANQFTDITGSNCWIPSPQTAAQSGARAVRRALGAAERMAGAAGARVDASQEGMAATARTYTPDDFGMLQQGMDIGGRMGLIARVQGRVSPSVRKTVGGQRGPIVYFLGKREAIARGKDLTRAAKDLHWRFTKNAPASEAVRLPNGNIVGNVLMKGDFVEALSQLMPNVDPAYFEEYFDNAIPGTLGFLDRRKYQSGFRAFWESQIFEMVNNQEAYKIMTIFEMSNDPMTALSIDVEPFAAAPGSGNRPAGVGPLGFARQSGSKLMADGGVHVAMRVSPFGMWTQMNNVGRDMTSDGSGWFDSVEGRMHYVGVHEAGHVVDFYEKLRAFGLDPNTMQRYPESTRVVGTQAGPAVEKDKWVGAWKINWSHVSNPMNNPYVQEMIDAAYRLQNTYYTGSRFSGRKIDLQDDLNTFMNNIAWAFQNNITHTQDDLDIMAAAVGNSYARQNGLEARAEYYTYRRLFGELRGARAASKSPGADILQAGPFAPTPSVAELQSGATPTAQSNLLTHFIDTWTEQELQRSLQPNGSLYQLQQQLPPGQNIPQSIVEMERNRIAADVMQRLNDIDASVFGVQQGSWNISGRMGQLQNESDRPPTLHAQRVRNAVRQNNIAQSRSGAPKGVSYISGKMGNPDPVKPQRPREPDNGPFTGKFLDVLRGASTWKEFAKKYRAQTVVFFDYETTGFGADGNMPVQIGAVKMRGGKVVERFNIFTNPGIPLGEWAQKNLKNDRGEPLTDQWLASQPSMKEAHEKLIEFFGQDALLGGQYTPFDLEVLERVLPQVGLEYKPAGVIDSKAMADEILPRWTPENPDGPTMVDAKTGQKKASNSLGPLAEYLEVDLGDGWHTADADSEASAMIIEKMLDRAASKPDTPRRILDVDQVPIIVRERRAKYEADMAEYTRQKAEYDQLISGRMGVVQFETANGSIYTRQADGRYKRKKSATLGTTMDDAESTFDNTIFLNNDDAYSIMAQGQRGQIIDKDGDLVGRVYNDENLDSDKFMSLRRDGDDFDTAYKKAGGDIRVEKIPAVRISREPQSGLQPVEWNNNDNTYHVGSPVSSITMESSTEISGRIGDPSRASKARTLQVREELAKSKSSVGAGMSDDYVENIWPDVEAKIDTFTLKPEKKADAVARRRRAIATFGTWLKDAIGSEQNPAVQTPLTPRLVGLELDFLAHISSMTDDQLEQEVLDAVSEFHAGVDVRPRVQVPQSEISRVIANGYKTTHEVGSDHSQSPIRKAYEAYIGIHPDVPNNLRPASGYIVHKDWLEAENKAAALELQLLPGAEPDRNFPEFMKRTAAESKRGPVNIYGGVEVVLRPEVAGRTYYGLGDSLNNRFVPTSLGSTDIDEISRPLVLGGLDSAYNMLDIIYGKWRGDYSSLRYDENSQLRPYYEAMIMGSFDAADIEEVIFPSTDDIPLSVLNESGNLPQQRAGMAGLNRNVNDNDIIVPLAKMLKPEYWSENANVDAEKAQQIADLISKKNLLSIARHRSQARGLAADKIRKQLEAAGAKVTVRNKQGLDYFDPQKWISDMEAKTVEDAIERSVRQRIMRMIQADLERATK